MLTDAKLAEFDRFWLLQSHNRIAAGLVPAAVPESAKCVDPVGLPL